MQQAWVRSLGWEDPLDKEMATHSSTLAWIIPWTEEPVHAPLSMVLGIALVQRRYSRWGHKELDMTKQLSQSSSTWISSG